MYIKLIYVLVCIQFRARNKKVYCYRLQGQTEVFGVNGSGFLHDEIVNAMGAICNDMSISRYKSNESTRKCFAMSSFFFEKVLFW